MDSNTLDFESLCGELIVCSGTAKSGYIEAIRAAREGKFEEAEESCRQADEAYKNAHDIHFKMFQLDQKAGTQLEEMLLIHAEDQLCSAETFKVISEEMLMLYRKLNK